MELKDYFAAHPKAALAFSGGVDSAYLLYAAAAAGAQVEAYYVRTAFQPKFEYRDALRLAELLGAVMHTIHLDVLSESEITANPNNRCYYCKKKIFTAISQAAAADGFTLLLDGTNASDQVSDRPGMKALQELHVESPLRLCGLTKAQIRELSRQAGLFTWNKPSYACLATRIPTGTAITIGALQRTEWAEESLKEMGFSDFRVRLMGDAARLELTQAQFPLLMEKKNMIVDTLKQRYSAVYLNLEGRNEQ